MVEQFGFAVKLGYITLPQPDYGLKARPNDPKRERIPLACRLLAHTNIPEAPWFCLEAGDKRRARLNCIRHLLSKVPYVDMTPPAVKLPPRQPGKGCERPPINEQFFVPNAYP